MSDSLKFAKPAVRASSAKGNRIRLKVADVMEAVQWLLAMPVGDGLLSAQVAQLIAAHFDNDLDRDKQALWDAAAQYLSVRELETGEVITALKAAWSKTEYVPWPLPKRLWSVRFFPKPVKPKPVKQDAAAITDDDVRF